MNTTTRLISAVASLLLTVVLFDSVASLAQNAHGDLSAKAPAIQTQMVASASISAHTLR
jgi:hypothetical protein